MNKKERLRLIRNLELNFLVECEDGQDGTPFDCMVLDKFDEMRVWVNEKD